MFIINKNLIAYRKIFGINQKTMANIAGCCLTSYCLKETGKKDFSQSEMIAILEEIKKRAPDATADEIFFVDEVCILKTNAV